MHRVLSFQMSGMAGRGFGESSEFVTKRMCFSFIFFFGFLALLGGFLLGRIATERSKERNNCAESSSGVLEAAGPSQLQYNLLLEELQNSSFDKFNFTEKSEEYRNRDDHTADRETVKAVLSDSNLFSKVVQQKSSLVATLLGSLEHDRWIVLSVSGDGTRLALELIRIFGKLMISEKWKPHRTIIFCFFNGPHDSCRDILTKYSKSRTLAYLAVHGEAVQKKGCLHVSGSDIIKSLVLGKAQESISSSDDGRVFDSCRIGDDSKSQMFWPRLALDVPHASISIKNNSDSKIEINISETEMLPYRRILTRIIGLTIWSISDTAVLHWDPKDFERSVKTALKLINSSQSSELEGKITSTTEKLVNKVQSLIIDGNYAQNSSWLSSRMTNDLLMDLDRALLCPDEYFRSKTDLALIPDFLRRSQDAISSFLENMLKCYNDAVELVIQEG